jgi:hypothetical protein
MADVKISGLPASSVPLAGTEVLPIVQGGQTRQVSVNNLTTGKAVSATQYTSTIATGTAPLVVASTTEVANLKAANATSADTANQVKSNATTGVLQVAGPSTGTTRVMTTPDANFTAARTDAAQTFTGAQTFSNGVVTSVADGLKILSGPNTLTQIYYSGGTVFNRFAGTTLFIAENGNSQLTIAPTTGDVTVSTGNLVIGTSGKGIDFSATSGTGTSELLADYEEGTWTPGQGAGLTVVGAFSSSGFYTKVGRVVTVSGVLVGGTSIVATNGTIVVTGLPFASNATSTGVVADSAYNNITGARTSGSDILAVGTTVAGANLVFSITYQV